LIRKEDARKNADSARGVRAAEEKKSERQRIVYSATQAEQKGKGDQPRRRFRKKKIRVKTSRIDAGDI